MSAAVVPGPWGSKAGESRLDTGTLARVTNPRPGLEPDRAAAGDAAKPYDAAAQTYSIDSAVQHLDANAHKKSQGKCAQYVRQAIEAGGAKIPLPRPLYAKSYGSVLARLGFTKIDGKAYLPKRGDIIVMQPPSGRTEGHMQMYNGRHWVSDFVQGEGIYPGPEYRKQAVTYEIYRP